MLSEKPNVNSFRAVACNMMKAAKFPDELIKSVFFHYPDFPPRIPYGNNELVGAGSLWRYNKLMILVR
ncbi:hypothetical protein EID71_07350 [Salmonella enterica subsp. indica serovar 11:b:e,n,x]|nr:hypothetical protein [Salmonella enterica subsp. indica serovar 11:b:e,n,x]